MSGWRRRRRARRATAYDDGLTPSRVGAIVAAPARPGYRAELARQLDIAAERIIIGEDRTAHTAALAAALNAPLITCRCTPASCWSPRVPESPPALRCRAGVADVVDRFAFLAEFVAVLVQANDFRQDGCRSRCRCGSPPAGWRRRTAHRRVRLRRTPRRRSPSCVEFTDQSLKNGRY